MKSWSPPYRGLNTMSHATSWMTRCRPSSGGLLGISSRVWKGFQISAWRPWPFRPAGLADQRTGNRTRNRFPILGLVADDNSDVLVLRMLGQLLAASGCTMEIITRHRIVACRSSSAWPINPRRLVVISHLPPEGSAMVRYLVQRLRARFSQLPIMVGRWGEAEGSTNALERLTGIGASRVLTTLADARAHILDVVASEQKGETVAAALSA